MTIKHIIYKARVLGKELRFTRTLKPGFEKTVYFSSGYDEGERRFWYRSMNYFKVLDEDTISLTLRQEIGDKGKPTCRILRNEGINKIEDMRDEFDKPYDVFWESGKERK